MPRGFPREALRLFSVGEAVDDATCRAAHELAAQHAPVLTLRDGTRVSRNKNKRRLTRSPEECSVRVDDFFFLC